MILTILISLLIAGFANNDISLIKNILLCENYYKNEIPLQGEYLLSKEIIPSSDSLLVKHENLLKTKGEKITGELFDIFCGLDIINDWYFYKEWEDLNPFSTNHEEFVEERKQELELYYLWGLKLSNSFNSHLILVSNSRNDDYNTIKSVFLVNVAGKKVVSITRISHYSCRNGNVLYIYTKLSNKGVFTQKEKQISSDVIVPKKYQLKEEKPSVKFIFDKEGFLKTL